jgi:hypothetical protein
VAQLVSLVQPADPSLDVQLADALAVLVVSEPPEDGVSRWEDDGGAVLPALELAA